MSGDDGEYSGLRSTLGICEKNEFPLAMSAFKSSQSKTSLRTKSHPSRVRQSMAAASHVLLHGHVVKMVAVGAAVRCCWSRSSTLLAKPSLIRLWERSGAS